MNPETPVHKTNVKCPICDTLMNSFRGGKMPSSGGVTVFCANLECTAQEVMAHGKNEKDAIEIVKEKYQVSE